MVVNDHTRSAENWKCVWYLLRLYIYIRVYVDSHSLGQFALASKRTASLTRFNKIAIQGAPQMAVDKEAISLSRVYSYYSKFNLPILLCVTRLN